MCTLQCFIIYLWNNHVCLSARSRLSLEVLIDSAGSRCMNTSYLFLWQGLILSLTGWKDKPGRIDIDHMKNISVTFPLRSHFEFPVQVDRWIILVRRQESSDANKMRQRQELCVSSSVDTHAQSYQIQTESCVNISPLQKKTILTIDCVVCCSLFWRKKNNRNSSQNGAAQFTEVSMVHVFVMFF